MRILPAIVALSLSAVAHAAPGRGVLSDEDVAAQCKSWSDDAAKAPNEQLKLGARVSFAHCMVKARFDALAAGGGEISVGALAAAAKPTIAIFDEVMQSKDPAYQIIAAQAKGDLYAAMITRMRIAGRTTEPQLAPFQSAATAAMNECVRIAKQHPDLAGSNPVVAAAVGSAERYLR